MNRIQFQNRFLFLTLLYDSVDNSSENFQGEGLRMQCESPVYFENGYDNFGDGC